MIPTTARQVRSLITAEGTLELSLVDVPVPVPAEGQILVRVQAAPVNPSDLVLLFGAADMATAVAGGTSASPTITATVPTPGMRAMAGRVGASMPVGNEGAGLVVAAGAGAEGLLGRTVAVTGGSMYADYRCVPAAAALVLPEGTTARQGAACFVNPLTALGMVGTMRREGHTALVHTAAASNLGQMLVKLCRAEGVPLVNVVRKPEQEALLRGLGAEHVVSTSSPTFVADLVRALTVTGATLGFDAIGGGRLAGQLLAGMEAAASASAKEYSRYGSSTHKQVYIYGALDRSPTELVRNFGMAWGLGGWLLPAYLQRVGAAEGQAMRERVAAELTTTFASHYTAELSLPGLLSLDAVRAYGRQATGEKFLVVPG